jgi:phosphoglucomutase
MPPNQYLSVAVDYLISHRPDWPSTAAIGTTVATSSILDRVADRYGRKIYETPVGFKWFVECLDDGRVCFAGEESAGASFLRRDGTVWTTDKDGITAALLSAEITAKTGHDPAVLYQTLTYEVGKSFYRRSDAPARQEQRDTLAALTPDSAAIVDLAGEAVIKVLSDAPGDGCPIGGIKVIAPSGWFLVRPSGTEDIYKIYAESFRNEAHLRRLETEAEALVTRIMHTAGQNKIAASG